jgi:hypothetical protein
MMDWILRNLPLFIFIFVVISIVRAAMRAKEMQEKEGAREHDLERQRRIQEVQEEIRRKIAERRGEVSAPPPLVTAPQRPVERAPAGMPPTEPYGGGGSIRRIMEEVERKLQPPAPVPGPAKTRRFDLERKINRAEDLKNAEDDRLALERRTLQQAAVRAETARQAASVSAVRNRLLADLRQPESLRRAFVLREVLGPPPGLR